MIMVSEFIRQFSSNQTAQFAVSKQFRYAAPAAKMGKKQNSSASETVFLGCFGIVFVVAEFHPKRA